MNFKKIIAAVAAAAVACSAMAISTFALSTKNYLKDGTVFVNADKAEDPTWAIDAGIDQTEVYGVTYHVTFNEAEVADEAVWIGGGIGPNSNSTGWKQIEWGRSGKEITADLANGTITWLQDTPIFAATDAYAQIWIQAWGGTITVNSADILGKDGVLLSDDVDTVAVAEDAVDETTAAVEDETVADEDVAPVEEEEVVDAEEDVIDEEIVDDEPVDEEIVEEATEEAPAADTATDTAPTGNTAAAAIAAVMAVAGVAALVSKKRN